MEKNQENSKKTEFEIAKNNLALVEHRMMNGEASSRDVAAAQSEMIVQLNNYLFAKSS